MMSNQWIEHYGGLRPVDCTDVVEYRRRGTGDTTFIGTAERLDWDWSNNEPTHDIRWYRLYGRIEQSSGGDNNYWIVNITNPKRLEPCRVECEDIIQALGMTFGEGEAFKAIWRGCAARMDNGKPGDTAMRNAEKVVHYGEYMKRDAQNEDGL